MSIPMGYRRIAADLRDRIARGEYPPGEQLPTYSEMAATYEVSVSTIQRAVMLLQAQGVIVGLQGRGLFVAPEQSPD